MSFFQHQARARRNTKLLVVLYVFTVLCIVVGTYFVLVAAWEISARSGDQKLYRYPQPFTLWHPDAFIWITGITVVLVSLGSLMKKIELSKGGEAVARMLGGTPLFANTQDPHERRVLNIVEEMAIASGIAVPTVFLLPEEQGINAFAAGYSPKDAVIGVTAGCIKNLSRDELQGVIAHEFSHILNGDMRLNIRLVSVLAGIMVISMVGYALWRIGLNSSMTPRSRREKNNSAMAFFVAGLLLYILGYVGALGARLIQSAVSRQREFLADSSAVQFTRNPLGISSALKKIGQLVYGSKLNATHAAEVGHFFFANGVSGFFSNMFATHPPLEERIRRIDPSFKGFEGSTRTRESFEDSFDSRDAYAGQAGFAASQGYRLNPETISEQVGAPAEKHLKFARGILGSIPLSVSQAIRQPDGARGVIFALLLDRDSGLAARQRSLIANSADSSLISGFGSIEEQVRALGPEFRLPLVELAIPVLQTLTPNDYVQFRQLVQALVEVDGKCSIFEYALQKVLRKALDWRYIKRDPKASIPSKAQMTNAGIELIGALALLTHANVDEAHTAFQRGLSYIQKKSLQLNGQWNSLSVFDRALRVLEDASFELKEPLLQACVACITADGTVSIEEAELIRALADGIDCPLPPLQ